MSARIVPAAVKTHAALVGAVLALNVWVRVTGRLGAHSPRGGEEIATLGLGIVVFGLLFLLMLGGRAWARIVLGILTLPVGILLLWPQSVRDYTDPDYRPDGSHDTRMLR